MMRLPLGKIGPLLYVCTCRGYESVMISLELNKLQSLVWSILTTESTEIGCDTCFAHLDVFAELVLAGKNAAGALPLVQAHLARCPACREEYEALLLALGGQPN